MSTRDDGKPVDPPFQMMEGVPSARPARGLASRFGQDPAAQAAFAGFGELYGRLRAQPAFFTSLDKELTRFAARPTALILAARYTAHLGGPQIYLKLEDRAPADAHLRIVADGHAFVARTLNRTRMVAAIRSLRAGERLASACARFGIALQLYAEPGLLQRKATEASRVKLLGATLISARAKDHGGDIRNAALQAWLKAPRETFLSPGLETGPEPFTQMLRDLTGVIGRECRRQVLDLTGRSPEVVVARDGDNAEALSLFPAFVADPARLVCVAPAPDANPQDPYDALEVTPSQQLRLAALLEGSDYSTLARERAALKGTGRIEYAQTPLASANQARSDLARLEGILAGPETAHALAWAATAARSLPSAAALVLLLAERPPQEMKVE